MTTSERDSYKLHPYYGERILNSAPMLAPYAEMVGTHQERLDGSGYFRGLRGTNISLGARIIAVADVLDELTHDQPGRPAIERNEALTILEADEGLDQTLVRRLEQALGLQASEKSPKWPAGLTDREIEVLRLAAQSLTRVEIGAALAISENTVRNHLDHIYTKTGTFTRVGATLYAIEQGIII